MGIVSPYRKQTATIVQSLRSPASHALPPLSEEQVGDLLIGSVELFQGSERDIILFSCVRSNASSAEEEPEDAVTHSLGFLSDWRRLNVAITRARDGLFVFGNEELLCKSKVWKAFIDDCVAAGQFISSDGRR